MRERSVPVLVERLLAAPEGDRHGFHRELLGLVRASPWVAELLPPFSTVPVGGPRQEVADLQCIAIRERHDVDAARAHLTERVRLGMPVAGSLVLLAGASADFAAVVLPFLADPEPRTRYVAASYLQQVVSREPAPELADWAVAILRSTVDLVQPRGAPESIAARTRRALVTTLAATGRISAFIDAAHIVDRELAAAERGMFRNVLRTSLPAALAETERRDTTLGADLLAAVYADLDDDVPRLVYADWLLETGDVRGEHILLQCLRHGTGLPPTERERVLEQQHAYAWLGAAGTWVARDLRFERGFLVGCVRGVGRIPPAATGDPVWSTLEELDMRHGPRGDDRFLASSVLARLRKLTGVRFDDLVDFPGRALEHLGVADLVPSRQVEVLSRQPRLVQLDLGASDELLLPLAAKVLPALRTITWPGRRFVRSVTGWTEV